MKKISKLCISLFVIIALLFIGIKVSNNRKNAKADQTKITYVKKKGRTIKVFNVPAFEKINVNINKARLDKRFINLKVLTGKNFQVKATGPDAKKIKATVNNKSLTISSSHSIRKGRYKVSVTVPNSDALQSITGYSYGSNVSLHKLNLTDIQLAAIYGDVTLDKIKTNELKLRQVYGDFTASNSTINKTSLTTDTGDTVISSCKFQINAKYSGVCDVEVEDDSKILGNSSFSLHEGDFIMYDSPKIGYNLSCNKKNKIKFFGRSHSTHFERTISNKPMLTVKDKKGNISIKD